MDKIDFQKGKRKLLRVIFGRTVLLFTALLLQAGILLFFMFKLAGYLTYYYWVSIVISVIMLIYILNSDWRFHS